MRVYILGGGPAGLALGMGLSSQSRIPFTLVERESLFGGSAKTLVWEEHGSHDLGPHKIFTLDKNLMDRVKKLIDESEWLTRPKKSSIFMNGHYLPYPPSPFSLIKVYGAFNFLSMLIDYLKTSIINLFKERSPKTFEEDLIGRMGRKLYEALFKPIALKLWDDPTRLDVKLSKGRVQTPSIIEIIKKILKIRKDSDFEALDFLYPRGGLQQLWDAIVEKSQENNTFLFNQEVVGISVEDGSVKNIELLDRLSSENRVLKVDKEDFIFSTIPLKLLSSLMENTVSKEMQNKIKDTIILNDLILVFLKIDKPNLLNESWVFVPDPKIPFHRLSEQASFDPDMTPNGSIVCAEIMSSRMHDIKNLSDSELFNIIENGILEMGYSGYKVLDSRVIRLNSSYPVFRAGFEEDLNDIIKYFDKIKNFRTIGRNGAFNYIGTLDAMDIGFGSAVWLINSKGSKDICWDQERKRTSHYPVLD